MPKLPFSISKRKGRRFFYVQFKNKNGGYLPAVSTKKTTEDAAIEVAFKWLREGKPRDVKLNAPEMNPANNANDSASSQSISINISISLREALRDVQNYAEADYICRELKRQGLLKTYVVTSSRQDVDFVSFLETFWDYDNSSYVKEKLRKRHAIHRNYTIDQKNIIKKYWCSFFQNKFLGEISRQDIERFIDNLSEIKIANKKEKLTDKNLTLPIDCKELSAGRKNKILRAGIIALRWAFAKELIEKNITTGITWFSEKTAERQILSPEIVQAIFQIEWSDNRCRLANMLAAVTGLRAGEIQALRVQDLGKDCLYIRHSWSSVDKLKTPKTNESRTVEVPFPSLIQELLNLAQQNPYGANMDSFVFWAEKLPSKPIEGRLFVNGLREALVNIGMSKTSASVYVFHGWRHFFTTYMISRLEKKLLKSQTGHKTDSMLYRYGDHWAAGDREKIRQAQLEVFGALVPSVISECPNRE